MSVQNKMMESLAQELLRSAMADLDTSEDFGVTEHAMAAFAARADAKATIALAIAQQEANRLANLANLIAYQAGPTLVSEARVRIERHLKQEWPELFEEPEAPRVQDAR